ncbi:solute carrier family 35 member F6 [Chrysoperla carnea]|uniref:solute carrier family 35 member F6 n=1 Tax=Chrysoperla carnea TaxID=189513 RepID=UPI001D05CEF5|nr:solute carrier family 35 member F6 [Chrysoperla carnea]
MTFTHYQWFLIGLLVITGSINTLSTKWADNIKSEGSDGVYRKFEHPFVQACGMFLGEFTCLIVFKLLFYYYFRKQDGSSETNGLVKGNREFNPFLLYLPAICDMTATSIMYIGLNLTYASSFQMLRGSVIVFVGLLSVTFLKRTLGYREWGGIYLILIGLTLVGLSDFNGNQKGAAGEEPDINSIITGDMLIIIAQIISAIQIVLEEKFVAGLDIPPLQAVGWEGLFGFLTLSVLLVPFYFIPVSSPFGNNAHRVLEDFPDAMAQIKNNPQLWGAIAGNVISIAFFNFAGISVTKEISATTRMVLDSVRTVFIWVISILLGWQGIHVLDVIGFATLIAGMCIYNNIVINRCIPLRTNYQNIQEDGTVVNRSASRPE